MVSRTLYDGYGQETPLLNASGSRYNFAGNHGYAEDGASGALLCGARFRLPAIGRFLSPDPIGHDGGLNLYAYCDNNPVGRIDPKGTQADIGSITGAFVQSALNWWNAGGLWTLAPQNESWINARNTTMLFEDGYGPTVYSYKGLNNPVVHDVALSQIGVSIRQAIASSSEDDLLSGIQGHVNSALAFRNTLLEFSNGTQAQVGAITWQAHLINKDINVLVYNKIGLNSLFYHVPSLLGFSDYKRTAPGQKYSDVKQFFFWKQSYRK